MSKKATKRHGGKGRSPRGTGLKRQVEKETGFPFADNRPDSMVQRRVRDLASRKLGSGFQIQRISMKLNQQFPATKIPANGEDVFEDSSIESISVQIPLYADEDEGDDGVRSLFVGQDYLNTGLSASYRNDSDNIAGGKPEILVQDDKNGYASIYEGHHRAIWTFYHGKDIDFQLAGLASKKKVGDMKYASAPEPILVQEEKTE